MTIEQELKIEELEKIANEKQELYISKLRFFESSIVNLLNNRLSGRISDNIVIDVQAHEYSIDINVKDKENERLSNTFYFSYEKDFSDMDNVIRYKINGYKLRNSSSHRVESTIDKLIDDTTSVDFIIVYTEFAIALRDRNELFDLLVSYNMEISYSHYDSNVAHTTLSSYKRNINNDLKINLRKQIIANFKVGDKYLLARKRKYDTTYNQYPVFIEKVCSKTVTVQIFQYVDGTENNYHNVRRMDKKLFAEMIMDEVDPRTKKMAESTEDASIYKKNSY